MNLYKEAADYLGVEGLGTWSENDTDGDIYVGQYPPKPFNLIAILSQPGATPRMTQSYDEPGMQIIVRNVSATAAFDLANNILFKLHGFRQRPFVEGGVWVVKCISSQSAPTPLGVDANKCSEFSLNFRLMVKNAIERS